VSSRSGSEVAFSKRYFPALVSKSTETSLLNLTKHVNWCLGVRGTAETPDNSFNVRTVMEWRIIYT